MERYLMVLCALALVACEDASSSGSGEALATSTIEEVEREVEKILGVDDEEEDRVPGDTDHQPGQRPAIPVARPVPDKPGFVVSPYNGKWIDVTGIEPGALVADPHAKSEEKKYFRVPPASDGKSDAKPFEDTDAPDPLAREPVV